MTKKLTPAQVAVLRYVSGWRQTPLLTPSSPWPTTTFRSLVSRGYLNGMHALTEQGRAALTELNAAEQARQRETAAAIDAHLAEMGIQ